MLGDVDANRHGGCTCDPAALGEAGVFDRNLVGDRLSPPIFRLYPIILSEKVLFFFSVIKDSCVFIFSHSMMVMN